MYFSCKNCSNTFSKWIGRCNICGSWNSLVQEEESYYRESKENKNNNQIQPINFIKLSHNNGNSIFPFPLENRVITNIKEFDRVCGGGLVPGSAVLVGGEPGIGKSTLLLQVAFEISKRNNNCIYISGEEEFNQVYMRAARLNISSDNIYFSSVIDVDNILKSIKTMNKSITLIIIDSIQTIESKKIDSSVGTINQIRATSSYLISFCKKNGIILILVGHVTKEGILAGPKILEHMVDVVLYFENEYRHYYRLLRAIKNRFGPIDEIGLFEITKFGLQDIVNTSTLFLNQNRQNISGSCITSFIEGNRPIFCEVQALIIPTYSLSPPKRFVVGLDINRLSLILAVLEARCGINLRKHDIFLNIIGDFKITESCVDLAIAASIVSSLFNKPLDLNSIFLGEIGLGGEIRSSKQLLVRVKEAYKFGFIKVYSFFPDNLIKEIKMNLNKNITFINSSNIAEFLFKLGFNEKIKSIKI